MSSRPAILQGKFRLPEFRSRLLAWYDGNARDLPWRKNRDPYRVWISEIMLQQTRVAAVIAHYHAFLQRFPTVEKLAAARESSVLAAWSGLGYYRRARMLHAAAKVVAYKLGGKFPSTSAGLRDLPGIGPYTAAAIASIAFDELAAGVDGNVERVIERIAGAGFSNQQIWKTAGQWLDPNRPGDFNQAMMELGATVCTPRAPACPACPVVDVCSTRGQRPPTAKVQRQQRREIHYALDCREGAVFLVQRPPDARLMAGMWELREISRPDQGGNSAGPGGRNSPSMEPLFSVRHSITTTNYSVRVWRVENEGRLVGEWVNARRLRTLALTGLARKILRRAGVLPKPSDAGPTF
jgi:A/G-specific adenine glycosylase